MNKRHIKPAEETLTARQIARRHTWTIYGISLVTGLRDKLRFRWNLEEAEFEDGALELNVFTRRPVTREMPRKWWEYGPDFTIGLTMDGSWYVYALLEGYDSTSGPYTDDVHIGDFPGFETAFFAMLTAMAKDVLDNIAEIRHERHMDRIYKKLERDGLLDTL